MHMRIAAACVAGLIVFPLVPRAAFAQGTPDLQRVLERLDKLEKQNQELMAEIQALRKELAQDKEAPGAAPTLAERMDVQESRTAELAQTKVETSQKIPVSLTGMVLFNAFKNGRNGGTLQDPVTAQLNPSASNTGATFRQTVLGLKFNGPDLPGGGTSSGSVYMDFFGGTQSPSNNLFRLRLATLSLKWKNTTITAGQDKPIVSPREPMTLAQVGLAPLSGAGNLWDWYPQVRVEQNIPFTGVDGKTGVRAELGVFQTGDPAPANATPAQAATLEKSRPGYEGRFNFYTGSENRRFEIAPGFHFSQSHFAGQSAPSKLGTLDWFVKTSRFFAFDGAFFKGENAAGLGALRQGFTLLPGGNIIPVHVTGGWSQLSLFPTARLSLHFYGGFEGDRGSDLLSNGVRRNLIQAGNITYKLAPNILAAFEVSQNRTLYTVSGMRLNNHYDLALAYLF
ncbi:MAG: hypothetical protein ABUS49_08915 [Acidobacteriota bacterium]